MTSTCHDMCMEYAGNASPVWGSSGSRCLFVRLPQPSCSCSRRGQPTDGYGLAAPMLGVQGMDVWRRSCHCRAICRSPIVTRHLPNRPAVQNSVLTALVRSWSGVLWSGVSGTGCLLPCRSEARGLSVPAKMRLDHIPYPMRWSLLP